MGWVAGQNKKRSATSHPSEKREIIFNETADRLKTEPLK